MEAVQVCQDKSRSPAPKNNKPTVIYGKSHRLIFGEETQCDLYDKRFMTQFSLSEFRGFNVSSGIRSSN